ncbi:hypothetical protein CLOM_g6584 [Closterium sp. NIES-68]|nr:hypothetical protein CLOM_g6584 [Closterium sp. NIES-68]
MAQPRHRKSVRSVANGWDELDNLEDLTVRRSPRSGGEQGGGEEGRGGAVECGTRSRRSYGGSTGSGIKRRSRGGNRGTVRGGAGSAIPGKASAAAAAAATEQQRRYAQAAPALEPEVVFGEDNEGSEEWRRAAGRVWEWIAVKSGAGASGGGGGGGGGGGAGRGAARAASALGGRSLGRCRRMNLSRVTIRPVPREASRICCCSRSSASPASSGRAAAALSAAIVAALPSTFQTTLVKPVVDGALLLSGVWLLRGLFEVTWRLGSIALLSLLPALGAMTLLSSANAPRQPHTAPFPAHQRAPPFASAPPPLPPHRQPRTATGPPLLASNAARIGLLSTGADYRAYGDNASWSEFDGYTAGRELGAQRRYERWEEVRDEDLGLGYAPRRALQVARTLQLQKSVRGRRSVMRIWAWGMHRGGALRVARTLQALPLALSLALI